MKRIAINLTVSLLAFACGLSVASLWNRSTTVHTERPNVIERSETSSPIATVEPEPTTHPEIIFGRDRLRLVSEQVQLRSERLRYEIDVTYPQIVGSEDRRIRKLNQHMKQLATKQYQWLLTPSKKDLQYYRRAHPTAFNSLGVNYDVDLATDSVLSISFTAYCYGIGAAHGSQYSFVINYDVEWGKELKLARLFKPGSQYLEFISRYCTKALSLYPGWTLELTKDPESWNFTRDGLRFTFDHCKFFACSAGSKAVEIPFADLKDILKTEFKF